MCDHCANSDIIAIHLYSYLSIVYKSTFVALGAGNWVRL